MKHFLIKTQESKFKLYLKFILKLWCFPLGCICLDQDVINSHLLLWWISLTLCCDFSIDLDLILSIFLAHDLLLLVYPLTIFNFLNMCGQ